MKKFEDRLIAITLGQVLMQDYLRNHFQRIDAFINAYVKYESGKSKPLRDSFYNLQNHISAFMQRESDARWFMLPGLRGTGKTTVLAQLYDDCKKHDVYRLYVSVDKLQLANKAQLVSRMLPGLILAYEDHIGMPLEKLDKPLFIFLDEIQYEQDWGVVLKTLYDSSNKVFIIATGSQALSLNDNADIVRRAYFEHILPLTFREFLKMKDDTFEIDQPKDSIKNLLFNSDNAKSLYFELKKLDQNIKSRYFSIDRFTINKYLQYGTLPSLLGIANESIIYEQIRTNLNKIIFDIVQLGKFSPDVAGKIDALLYLLADSDVKSLELLSRDIGVSEPTLAEVLSVLESAEVLQRIFPYASHTSQVSKSSKYLFVAPAFRAMYFYFIGSTRMPEDARGKLLEDLVAMYLGLRKEFRNKITSLNFDAERGGADFIVSIGKVRIAIEVGMGDKNCSQVIKTQKKVGSKYNLVISDNPLYFSEEYNTVKIPLELFLLL